MKGTQFPHALYYLTDQLPGKYGYGKMLLEALKGKVSRQGKPYTPAIITNVIRGLHPDSQVLEELEKIVDAYNAKRARAEKRAEKRTQKLKNTLEILTA